MVKRIPLLLVLCSIVWLSACDFAETPSAVQVDPRGRLLSYEELEDWSPDEINELIESLDPFLFFFLNGRFGVKMMKVTYETIDHTGAPSIATGAVAVPYGDTLGRVPISCYAHGTTMHRTGVPSYLSGDTRIGVILGGDGFVVAMPDFVGLGDSPVDFHPYVHAISEASAMIDIIRCTEELLEIMETTWNEQLFLFGYSQGGHAAMATHRELQLNHRDEYTVTASAPMAGPYDASGVQEQVIVGYEPYPTPGYLPFILYAYNMVYDIVDNPDEMFKPPYDSIIPPMMNGSFSIGEVNTVANPVPRMMLKDSVMEAYENDPNHPLKVALRKNDLWDWKPETNMRMYYCEGDDQVSYENALVAYDHFMERGASPEIVSLENVNSDYDHNDCALPTMLAAKLWFDTMVIE